MLPPLDKGYLGRWVVAAGYLLVLFSQYWSKNDSTCQSLAEGGYWQKSSHLHTWQPSTCTIGMYKAQHIDDCFAGGQKFTFIGDSTVRHIFYSIAKRVDPGFQQPVDKHIEHQQVNNSRGDLTIDYYWDAVLYGQQAIVDIEKWHKGSFDKPGALIIGTGLHYAAFIDSPVANFTRRLDALFPPTDGPAASPPRSRKNNVHLYIAPVLPSDQVKLQSQTGRHKDGLIPSIQGPMNDFLRRKFPSMNGDEKDYTTLWAYNEQVLDRPDAHSPDGIHVEDYVAETKADILLNHFCNARLAESSSTTTPPYGATCCRRGRNILPGSYTAALLALVVMILAPLARSLDSKAPIFDLSNACLLAFTCDRTEVLGKMAKLNSQTEFIVCTILLVVVIPSFISIARSRRRMNLGALPLAPRDEVDENDLPLSRGQTDEWKGWMQVVILVYHWTGASKITWVYRFIRLLVAAYIFMTAYGNTLYYLQQDDYSWRRLRNQLFRLNFLTIIIAYTMGTSYLAYYFIPLITLWTFVVYATMTSFRRYNTSLALLTFKATVVVILMTIFVKKEGILEAIFSLLRHTLNIDWDAEATRFRLSLDLYIAFFGMLSAYIVGRHYTSEQLIFDSRKTSLTKISLQALTLTTSLSIFVCWCFFSYRAPSNDAYNSWHPYISPFVILAFAAARNSTAFLRRRHSKIMARIGRCSLELFVLQFHIFLADDTRATLSLGLERYLGHSYWWARYFSAIVIFIVFLGVSERTAKATTELRKILLDDELQGSKSSTPIREDDEMQNHRTPAIEANYSILLSSPPTPMQYSDEIEKESDLENEEHQPHTHTYHGDEDDQRPKVPLTLISRNPLSRKTLVWTFVAIFAIILNWTAYSHRMPAKGRRNGVGKGMKDAVGVEVPYLPDKDAFCTLGKPNERFSCKFHRASRSFNWWQRSQSKTPWDAVTNYKIRYKREPPPGFADWAQFALKYNSTMIDEYDQIESDLLPHRNFSGKDIRRNVREAYKGANNVTLSLLEVKNGTISYQRQDQPGFADVEKIISPILDKIPDLQILLNWDDRPAARTDPIIKSPIEYEVWTQDSALKWFTKGCPLSSHLPVEDERWRFKPSLDLCDPKFKQLESKHGSFQTGGTAFPSTLPILSTARFSTSADINVPHVVYQMEFYRSSGGDVIKYEDKLDSLYWRGSNSGQTTDDDNWDKGHRAKFVLTMQKWKSLQERLQSQSISIEQAEGEGKEYDITHDGVELLSTLNPSLFNVSFSRMVFCQPETKGCDLLQAAAPLANWTDTSESMRHKFLFDLDGNGMSGRYYRLLETNSLVFKQALFSEWHDDRILPWVHYIPVDLEYTDLLEMLNFFSNDPEGRIIASTIASNGRNWASKALRPIDLTIYYYRLLLEYAVLYNAE